MSTFSEIQANDLRNTMAIESILLIDVRNDDEIAHGMIEGAIHVPLALLPIKYEFLPKLENIVFYCHSGIRSAHAAAFASSKGDKNVYSLIGGVLAWVKAGYSFVAKDEEKGK